MSTERVRLSLEEYKKLLQVRGEIYNGEQPNHLGKYRVRLTTDEIDKVRSEPIDKADNKFIEGNPGTVHNRRIKADS